MFARVAPRFASNGARQLRPITTARRRQIKKAKAFGSWVAVFGGAFALWKGLDWLDDSWNTVDGEDKEKIVILGSGFAALSMVDSIDSSKFDVTVISPRSYFLYTPSLPDTVSGNTDHESIVEPIRSFGERTKSRFTYYEAKCTHIDPENNKISCTASATGGQFEVPFDQLVVAVGALNNTHGIDSKKLSQVHFLTSLNDARRLRNKMIESFERACLPGTTDEEKAKLLHFVVVGGGPTARKTAREMSDFLKESTRLVPELETFGKVTLVNYLDHIHNYYDHSISNYYRKKRAYRKSGVVDIDNLVTDVNPNQLTLQRSDGSHFDLPFGVCVWSTGTVTHPLARALAQHYPETQTNTQSLIVSPDLRVLGAKNIFALGDCSTMMSDGLRQNYASLFKTIDANDDGRVDIKELSASLKEWGKKYPGLLEVSQRLNELFQTADVNKDGVLEIDEFKQFVKMVDSGLTRYPGTASTAVQQGQYLAQQFNKGKYKQELDEEDPTASFRYKHIGGYEYVAADKGLRERGSKGEKIITGPGAQWMYENVYFSVLVGSAMRTRMFFSSLARVFTGNSPTSY